MDEFAYLELAELAAQLECSITAEESINAPPVMVVPVDGDRPINEYGSFCVIAWFNIAPKIIMVEPNLNYHFVFSKPLSRILLSLLLLQIALHLLDLSHFDSVRALLLFPPRDIPILSHI
ncbi:hypothetical protein DFS33DRAFT_1490899 [Desarmillaria ectypa]|nr:hypothetical protein DFS33DRAFT_1490899 [Desarmillaria ectypa]